MSPTRRMTDDSSPISIRCFYSNNPFTHLDISVEPHHRFSSTYHFRNHDAIEQLYPIPVDSNDCRARYGMEDIQDYRSCSGKEGRVGVVICICYSGGRTMIYSFYLSIPCRSFPIIAVGRDSREEHTGNNSNSQSTNHLLYKTGTPLKRLRPSTIPLHVPRRSSLERPRSLSGRPTNSLRRHLSPWRRSMS
jgi:hypothetical protein